MNREELSGVQTPESMRSRPVDHRGFPVPWFVTEKTEDGNWDFVNVTSERFAQAVKHGKCWVSGKTLGSFKAFCIGPMCVINRTAGDPPVTKEMAEWSVKVCPFMSRPLANRAQFSNDSVIEMKAGNGVGIARNPGVSAVWVTKNSRYENGRGFYIGDPVSVSWWCKGEPATRRQVLQSVDSGIHFLEEAAFKEGPSAMKHLEYLRNKARDIWPSE